MSNVCSALNIVVRKARMHDIRAIHGLLLTCSADQVLMPRSLSDLYGHLRDFYVAEQDGSIVGCCALAIIWDNLCEVRSLALDPKIRRRGCGRQIVNTCLDEAKSLGIDRVFALTYQLAFFQALGFEEVSKDILPQKVWMDCIHCPKFPDCDEFAVARRLS